METFFCVILLVLCGASCSTSTAMYNHKHYHHGGKSFSHLAGSRKGDNVVGLRDVKMYLHRYGYLESSDNKNYQVDDSFDDSLERALLTYQEFFQLNKTGVLDHNTIFDMSQPRCGNRDIVNASSSGFPDHYKLFPGRPKRTSDTLYVVIQESVPANLVNAISQAFAEWEPFVPLVFLKTLEPGGVVPDIRVGFFTGDHGDGYPFDGPGGVLAHATEGQGSKFHFDAEENWQTDSVADGFHVTSVARHEIGHLLGLAHSTDKKALMYPTINRGQIRKITSDDIAGIKDLYFG